VLCAAGKYELGRACLQCADNSDSVPGSTSATACLCILSTDGDYLPLALLQTCNKECDVLLFRIKTQIPESASTKRKIADCQQQHSTIHDQHKNSRRTYEYVRIAPIACWIKETLPSKAVEPVRQFCAMVALCGCDFARNLPRVGPRTLWKMRHRLQHIDLLQPPQIVSALAIGYTELFVMKNGLPAGMRNNTEWFQDAGDDQVCLIYSNVAARIQANNKVCQRIKSQFGMLTLLSPMHVIPCGPYIIGAS
jgi:hypothetical protein